MVRDVPGWHPHDPGVNVHRQMARGEANTGQCVLRRWVNLSIFFQLATPLMIFSSALDGLLGSAKGILNVVSDGSLNVLDNNIGLFINCKANTFRYEKDFI